MQTGTRCGFLSAGKRALVSVAHRPITPEEHKTEIRNAPPEICIFKMALDGIEQVSAISE